METVEYDPTKGRLVLKRDGVELPPYEREIERTDSWRNLRTYGRIGGHGGAKKRYKTLDIHLRERRGV